MSITPNSLLMASIGTKAVRFYLHQLKVELEAACVLMSLPTFTSDLPHNKEKVGDWAKKIADINEEIQTIKQHYPHFFAGKEK